VACERVKPTYILNFGVGLRYYLTRLLPLVVQVFRLILKYLNFIDEACDVSSKYLFSNIFVCNRWKAIWIEQIACQIKMQYTLLHLNVHQKSAAIFNFFARRVKLRSVTKQASCQ